jgi:hypothetical protein
MHLFEMPRKPRLFRFDDRVLDALDALAESKGANTNQFVEGILFDFLKRAGRLPQDATQLQDGRGGKRPGAGRKSTKTDDPAIDGEVIDE